MSDAARALYPPTFEPPTAPLSLLAFLNRCARNPLATIPAAAYTEAVTLVEPVRGRKLLWVCDPRWLEQILVRDADVYRKTELERRVFAPVVGDGVRRPLACLGKDRCPGHRRRYDRRDVRRDRPHHAGRWRARRCSICARGWQRLSGRDPMGNRLRHPRHAVLAAPSRYVEAASCGAGLARGGRGHHRGSPAQGRRRERPARPPARGTRSRNERTSFRRSTRRQPRGTRPPPRR